MTQDFRAALASGRLLLLDGAMGTMLQASGLPKGLSPERFCFERKELLLDIHKRYLAAGCDILTTCTFGANPYKLEAGLELRSFNEAMAKVACAAAKSVERKVYVAGNLGPSGQFLRPLGKISPREFISAYAKQVEALCMGGVDCFLLETQFDLAEARALVVAVREVCALPIMVSMTFEGETSLTGSSPEIFCATMENLGVEVIGTNCSLGPVEMLKVVERMLAVYRGPLLVEPNAGLPRLENGETVFPLGPEEYVDKTMALVKRGARIVGGCCGTSPKHISLLHKALVDLEKVDKVEKPRPNYLALTSRSKLVSIGGDAPLVLIGERINPTGKKALSQELQAHGFDLALSLADEQVSLGAKVLDVNVGAPMLSESEILPELVELLVARQDLPLSLDSSDPAALALALPYCPGSALLNSINGEGERLEKLAPLCARFGAPFILLPLQGKKLPVLAKERVAILEGLLKRLEALKIPPRLILVDVLALTVSAKAESAKECLKFLRYCQERSLPTTMGLSNISFGLPARELLNATFLAMARGAGLSSCLANPSSVRINELLASLEVLEAHDAQAANFISKYGNWKQGERAAALPDAEAKGTIDLKTVILKGDLERVEPQVKFELESGSDPLRIVSEILIPAITEVGARYERKEYFLPQLIRSAETMQKAFAYLEPLLKASKQAEKRPVIIMATVEGDIHDIGKNIVSLLLGNHGFEVIDLGKDVPASKIVAAAEEHKASLIGLSALMTTTMVKMSETIELVRERKLKVRVMVGGAAVTADFANSIGADGYGVDAVAAVKTALSLCA